MAAPRWDRWAATITLVSKTICGIVAVSVSRAFNPGNQLFVGTDELTVKERLGDEVQRLGESENRTWLKIAERRIVGVLFHVITPAHIQDINLLTAAQQTVVFALPGWPVKDVEILRAFADAIS